MDPSHEPDPTTLTTEGLLREIAHLKELMDEKFEGRDKALVAALQASKESVAKSEASTSKQLDAMNIRIDELRDRENKSEGRGAGISQSWGFFVAAAGILIALILHFVK